MITQYSTLVSSNFNDRLEWALRDDVFSALCTLLSRPDIDLIA